MSGAGGALDRVLWVRKGMNLILIRMLRRLISCSAGNGTPFDFKPFGPEDALPFCIDAHRTSDCIHYIIRHLKSRNLNNKNRSHGLEIIRVEYVSPDETPSDARGAAGAASDAPAGRVSLSLSDRAPPPRNPFPSAATRLQGFKCVGDPNVPGAKYSFVVDLGTLETGRWGDDTIAQDGVPRPIITFR